MGAVLDFGEDLTGINMSNNSSSDRALNSQRGAVDASNTVQRQIFDQNRQDNDPYRQAGVSALTGMQGADFNRDFTMGDFTKDPGYDFRMKEGLKAIQNSAAARGGLGSGATMKSLMGFGQGLASDEYQKSYDRFNADRDRRFGRLGALAGIGQTANQTVATSGQNYANNFGQNIQGAANAQASQAVGQANQFSGLLGQGATAAALAFCDERLKTNVKPVTKEELAEMRRHLRAVKFNYKSAVHGTGEFVGVMAQDLEKSDLGRTLVFEDNFGNKQIDLQRVMMLFLATMAEAA